MTQAARILRGRTVCFRDNPRVVGVEEALISHTDGAIALGRDGRIVWHGSFADRPAEYSDTEIEHYPDRVIMPGFIDAHVHFPQHRMLAAPAKDLLTWLNRFAFPEEARYGDGDHVAVAAELFLDKLMAHGTTSALVFSSVHKNATDGLFQAARARGMGLITGKTMMDRNAPDAITDSADAGVADSADLIAKWHRVDRLRYAITLRFAVTSSEAQMHAAGALYAAHPDCHMHSHISESAGEIAFVKELFPWSRDYTDVYERHGLLGRNAVFAHGIHLSERECQVLHEAGAMIVHCPTSNMFLGSGLFDIDHLSNPARPVNLGIATDVAGGTSYSMLQTLAGAYQVAMLKGRSFSAFDGFYLATLGNARGLRMADEIGSFAVGAWADIVVLDPTATPVLAARHELSEDLEDILFALMMLGDDRAIDALYIKGKKVLGDA